jgi:hypothetical protein
VIGIIIDFEPLESKDVVTLSELLSVSSDRSITVTRVILGHRLKNLCA